MFGPKNPLRVAEKQLNQAQLDLLEVCGNLEGFESQKRTLEERIARLKGYLSNAREEGAPSQDPRVLGTGKVKLGRGLEAVEAEATSSNRHAYAS